MPPENPLNNISVANPCRANWDSMEVRDAGGAVRHCQSCHKNVYNLSLMSHDQALALIQKHEGDLCVRFARRADGTVVTGDCPVGMAAKRRRRGWTIAALLAALIPSPVSGALKRASAATLRAVPVFSALENTPAGKKCFAWLEPPAPPPSVTMGFMIALPPTTKSRPPIIAPTPTDPSMPDAGK